MTGTISVVRPPPGTATFKNIKAGEGKTRVDDDVRFFDQLSNQEDEDVNVLLGSNM